MKRRKMSYFTPFLYCNIFYVHPNLMHHSEILIIGAGPAGATASLYLSKMKVAHTIVDAAIFPRDKICGDGLDLKIVRVLRQLDPNILEEIRADERFLPSWGARFTMQSGRQVDFEYKPKAEAEKPVFWTSKRFDFDDFLIRKIDPNYADFRQGTKVTNLIRTGDLWRVEAVQNGQEVLFSTKLIIAADGDHSVMLRHIGQRKIDRGHYAGSVRQYWSGINGFHEKNLIEVYFPKSLPMSYFYMFPLPNGEANVGYGMVSSMVSKYQHNLRDIFQKIVKEDPIIAPRFSHAESLETPVGWGLPLASLERKAFGDGYLLTGDAASLICPTSGEGIGTGMISGYIAAHFAQRAVQQKQYGADQFKHYDREIYRRLNGEIRTYNLFMRLSPHTYDWILNLLAPNPVFRYMFQRQAAGWVKTAYEKDIEVNFD